MRDATRQAALALRDVDHWFGAARALAGVSFALAPGETLALLGESGSGKSTLLRIAAGLERQSAGEVRVAGAVVGDDRSFVPPERRGLGLVFQDFALFPHLSLADNVAFGLRDAPANARRKTATAMLERVGLGGRADDFPHRLSGGEQQRAALARALAPQPRVLLMDEPFSNLDLNLRRDMRSYTQSLLQASGAASVIVTHDPDDAMALADRIAVMRAGRIVQIDTPQALYERPVDPFVLRFFSDVETWDGAIRGGAMDTPFGRMAAPGLPDGPGVLMVRKSDLILATEDKGEGLPGLLESRRFMGRGATAKVVLSDGRALEIHTANATAARARPNVRIRLERDNAYIFSKEHDHS